MPRKGWTETASADEFMRTVGILRARQAGLFAAAKTLQSVWADTLSAPGTGKLYEAGVAFFTTKGSPRRVVATKGSPGLPSRARAHRASKPGDPPAKDRGLLAASVAIDPPAAGSIKNRVRVGMGGTRGRIGLALEKGVNVAGSAVGRHPATNFKIEPRPHARPAGERAKPAMTKGITIAMRKVGVDVRLSGA